MKIYLYSSQDISVKGGGGNSSSTTYQYLKRAGEDVTFFKSISHLDKAISESKPELLLHHNIKELGEVYKLSKKHGIKLIVTINNLITCMTGVHIKYGSEFGDPCYRCKPFDALSCQFSERNVRCLKEKIIALTSLPFRYFSHIRRISLLNKVDGVIAISPTLKRLLIMNGVKREIYVCPQPIDNSYFEIKLKKASKKKILFYQGGGEPFKGIRVLLKAFNKLNRPDVVLLIAGDIRPENNINIGRIRKNNRNIHFLGHLEVKDMRRYHQMADIFIFPSLWLEAYGRGWAEAACCGKPILIFKNRGGPSDYLRHMKTGYIVDPEMGSFIAGMAHLLDNAELRKRLGANSKGYARENLAATEVIHKLQRIYSEVLFQ